MADYHTVYQGTGETTEWDDLQVKFGNKEKPPPKWKPEKYVPKEDESKDKSWLDGKDETELSDLEDDFEDDAVLEEYRRKRLEELRQGTQAPLFGSVEQIGASDFVREITNAGEDIWVVLHLFKDGVAECRVMDSCLNDLAKKYTRSKFRKIISTECIPKYPDSNLPTLLVYKDKQCLKTLVGMLPFGGKRASPEQVAFTLNRFGPICRLEGEEHTQEPSIDEIKKYMEKFIMDEVETQRQEKEEEDDS
mmetsp:Transcript_38484/g.108771  ORF Transcript_38484/g.108771 Transcript_38484/m.108771 type:complete len:249 (+) Transcript_38484:359-1105(+)|eukprot:CAMPEP_0117668694 /NCGR_PEP_ID=MMETSP0804-20121206/11696_1 /TAXON_ID=1074897 /ORGANISM="Tetraselmis astigmatica, Strain CCMP880" /LENGTH=248 /DNA_ID=CAMNT_0005476623 /DNA_START=249 /DNA_END=995 /DNA_ORIENTATION=+